MASILKVDTIQDQSGNNIINESGDTITIGASGDTIIVPTGASMTVPNGGLSGQNYPAFFAYQSDGTGQSIPSQTWTKVQVEDEIFDTDDCYDNTTNYRFTPNIAGKYLLQAQANFEAAATFVYHLNIRKNGSELFSRTGVQYISATNIGQHTSYLVEANGTTDYFEFYIFNNDGSARNLYPNSTYNWSVSAKTSSAEEGLS
jgi:hypothetical protein